MRRRDQRRAAVFALYQADVTDRPAAQLLGPEATPFTRELVDGVEHERPTLDELIGRYAENWELERMAVVDRNILRQAIFELRWATGVPPKVAINEALEVAKKFSTQESSRFINGILDRIHKEQAPTS